MSSPSSGSRMVLLICHASHLPAQKLRGVLLKLPGFSASLDGFQLISGHTKVCPSPSQSENRKCDSPPLAPSSHYAIQHTVFDL